MRHGQTLDLETSCSVYQRSQVLLTDGDLASVHVDQELLHVPGGDPVQVDDVVLLPVSVLCQQ